MNEPAWKQVSAAECLKWRVDNPGKEAIAADSEDLPNAESTIKIRWNLKTGVFEFRNGIFISGEWNVDVAPGDPKYTYFIPEVTE